MSITFGRRLAPLLLTAACALAGAGCGGSDGPAAGAGAEAGNASGGQAPVALTRASPAATVDGPDAALDAPPAPVQAAAPPAARTGYFVDATVGADSNPGTEAQPFATLGRLRQVKLLAGQGFWLRCGSVWREALTLGPQQLADGATVSGYGDCATAKARITGAQDLTGAWTLNGKVWSRKVPEGLPKITRLYVNRVAHRTAQWPNHGGIGHEYALVQPDSGRAKLVLTVAEGDRAALAGKDVIGAGVAVRNVPWQIRSTRVSRYDGATGRMDLADSDPAHSYDIEGGEGYLLNDKRWMLDARGEFFHDQAAGMLHVIPAASLAQQDLRQLPVEGAVRAHALAVSGVSGLRISQMQTDITQEDGLIVDEVPGALVEDVESSRNGSRGIVISQRDGAPGTVRNSRFVDNGLLGIDAEYATGARLRRNTVLDTGTIGATGAVSAGIRSGAAALVESNLVVRSAGRGIQFLASQGAAVRNNTIEAACLRVTDCGGIYTWNGQEKAVGTSTVEGNTVIASAPNTEGALGGAFDQVMGIYLDLKSTGVTVRDNTVAHATIGLMLEHAPNNVIEGNRIWLSTYRGLDAHLPDDQAVLHGNKLHGNQFVPITTAAAAPSGAPRLAESLAMSLHHGGADAAAIGANTDLYGGNQILSADGHARPAVALFHGGHEYKYSAAGWYRAVGDANSPGMAVSFDHYQLDVGTDELFVNGNFDSGLSSWAPWFYSGAQGGRFVLAAAAPGCLGPCAEFKAASVHDVVSSTPFKPTNAGLRVVSFAAQLPDVAAFGEPRLERPGQTLEPEVAAPITALGHGSVRFEGFYTSAGAVEPKLVFGLRTPGVAVHVDRFSVRQVNRVRLSRPQEWIAVAHARAWSARQFDCADLHWPAGCQVVDAAGTPVPLPVAVPAGGARLLMRADSPWRTK